MPFVLFVNIARKFFFFLFSLLAFFFYLKEFFSRSILIPADDAYKKAVWNRCAEPWPARHSLHFLNERIKQRIVFTSPAAMVR